jgi:tetratricopeptide (TPR) repeat protein
MPTEANTSAFTGIVGFTGRLASMKREEAFALVRQKGGSPRRGVTRKTRVLVVGQLGWPLLPDGRLANSLQLAKTYRVEIASEQRFLEWTGRVIPREQVRPYESGQIASLSGLPLDVVELLTAFGLLDCRDGRYGFRDLASARQLAGLLASRVKLSAITKSLQKIHDWLPEASLANLKLYPASSDTLLVEYMKGRLDTAGQFVLPVEESKEDADALFEQAQAAERAQDTATAKRLYEKVVRMDPSDPTAAFNLGNLLRGSGQKVEAETAYRSAIKADARFAEAWYNLADLLDEQGQLDKAIACLIRAVDAEPNYADALFNLGLLHQREDKPAAAAAYWRRYLALDNSSDWAARAKQALKYCEMQIARSA